MAFDDILGHDRARDLLAHLLASHRLPQALLLTGPSGIGKRSLALEVARAMVCSEPTPEGCGVCSACRRVRQTIAKLPELRQRAVSEESAALFNHRLHPDLILAEPSPQGALDRSKVSEVLARPRQQWTLKVEQVRELVKEVALRPYEAHSRAIIIDDAHQATMEGFNSLLKSLEEPPRDTYFILVTSSPDALLATIRSRCQVLRLGPLPDATIENLLVERRGLRREEARLRARLAGGSVAQALLFESESFQSVRDGWLDLLLELPTSGVERRLAAAEEWSDQPDVTLALTALRSLLRDVALLAAGADEDAVINRDVVSRLETLARGPIGARAEALAERVAEARDALGANANRRLTLDVLLEALAEGQ